MHDFFAWYLHHYALIISGWMSLLLVGRSIRRRRAAKRAAIQPDYDRISKLEKELGIGQPVPSSAQELHQALDAAYRTGNWREAERLKPLYEKTLALEQSQEPRRDDHEL